MARIHRCVSLAIALALWSVAPAAAQDATPRGAAVRSPEGSALPDGNGCAGAIARHEAGRAEAVAGGTLGLEAYNRIKEHIARATALCQAGQDAAARRMLDDPP